MKCYQINDAKNYSPLRPTHCLSPLLPLLTVTFPVSIYNLTNTVEMYHLNLCLWWILCRTKELHLIIFTLGNCNCAMCFQVEVFLSTHPSFSCYYLVSIPKGCIYISLTYFFGAAREERSLFNCILKTIQPLVTNWLIDWLMGSWRCMLNPCWTIQAPEICIARHKHTYKDRYILKAKLLDYGYLLLQSHHQCNLVYYSLPQ